MKNGYAEQLLLQTFFDLLLIFLSLFSDFRPQSAQMSNLAARCLTLSGPLPVDGTLWSERRRRRQLCLDCLAMEVDVQEWKVASACAF